jgi:hypothetical protein
MGNQYLGDYMDMEAFISMELRNWNFANLNDSALSVV